MAHHAGRSPLRVRHDIPESVREQLEALGYSETAPAPSEGSGTDPSP